MPLALFPDRGTYFQCHVQWAFLTVISKMMTFFRSESWWCGPEPMDCFNLLTPMEIWYCLVFCWQRLTICSFSTHFIQTSRLTSTWTTRATRRFRCPSDKNLQISKRSILVSGFSGKWSLTGKASGASQCWAQTIHTQLRLHLALRLHKRCPGSGDGDSHWGTLFLFQATQVLYQHHPPQLCEHSGDGGGAFDRLLCWGFLSSCSRVPGGSRHFRRASHMRWR